MGSSPGHKPYNVFRNPCDAYVCVFRGSETSWSTNALFTSFKVYHGRQFDIYMYNEPK